MTGNAECDCGHAVARHAKTGRCGGRDSYGCPCECDSVSLVMWDDENNDPDDQDVETDLNDYVVRRSVSRQEEVLHAATTAEWYSDAEKDER